MPCAERKRIRQRQPERERGRVRGPLRRQSGEGVKGRRDQKDPPPRPWGKGSQHPPGRSARQLPSGRTVPATPPPTLTHLTASANQLRGGREVAEGASPAANQRWGRAGPLAASLSEGGGARLAAPSTAGALKGTALRGATRRGALSAGGQQPPPPLQLLSMDLKGARPS